MHLIFRGLPVYFSAHAEKRAEQRGIGEDMMRLALSKPRHARCVNPERNVWLLEREIGERQIRVVVQCKRTRALLLTVMWITRPSRPFSTRANKRFLNRPGGHRRR